MPSENNAGTLKWLLWLTIPLYVIDIITKAIIVQKFDAPPPTDSVSVIDGFFNIVRVHNTGIAFGRFNNTEGANLIFGAIAIAALIFIIWMWKKNQFPTRIGKTAAALLIAGILGNLTDRIVYGYVVDFMDFEHDFFTIFNSEGNRHFASFNVADSCISIAAVCLFVSAFQKVPENDGDGAKMDESATEKE